MNITVFIYITFHTLLMGCKILGKIIINNNHQGAWLNTICSDQQPVVQFGHTEHLHSVYSLQVYNMCPRKCFCVEFESFSCVRITICLDCTWSCLDHFAYLVLSPRATHIKPLLFSAQCDSSVSLWAGCDSKSLVAVWLSAMTLWHSLAW